MKQHHLAKAKFLVDSSLRKQTCLRTPLLKGDIETPQTRLILLELYSFSPRVRGPFRLGWDHHFYNPHFTCIVDLHMKEFLKLPILSLPTNNVPSLLNSHSKELPRHSCLPVSRVRDILSRQLESLMTLMLCWKQNVLLCKRKIMCYHFVQGLISLRCNPIPSCLSFPINVPPRPPHPKKRSDVPVQSLSLWPPFSL